MLSRRVVVLPVLLLALACARTPVEKAKARIVAGDYVQAEKILERTVRSGRSSEALILMGRIHLMRFDAEAARSSFRKAILVNRRSRPEAARAIFDAARSIYAGEHALPHEDFALSSFREAVAYDPSVATDIAEWALVTASAAARRPGGRDPFPLLALATELHPPSKPQAVRFLRETAAEALKRGRFDRSRMFAGAMPRIDAAHSSDAATLLRDVAMAADTAGDLEAARTALDEALRLDASLAGELDVVILRSKLNPAEAGAAAAATNAPGQSPLLLTMSTLAAIDRAIGQYGKDYGHYPDRTDIDQLMRLLSPAYVDEARSIDGWQQPLRYMIDVEANEYRIMSAGADGIFEPSSAVLHSRSSPVFADDPNLDIIYENGACVQCPSQKLIAAMSAPR